MQQPLFEADCEIQQLMCIFQVLGTPTEEVPPSPHFTMPARKFQGPHHRHGPECYLSLTAWTSQAVEDGSEWAREISVQMLFHAELLHFGNAEATSRKDTVMETHCNWDHLGFMMGPTCQ